MSLSPYQRLTTFENRMARAQVMRMAWGRFRRERDGYVAQDLIVPADLFGRCMRQSWDWARAVARGRGFGTLYDPRDHQQMREAA